MRERFSVEMIRQVGRSCTHASSLSGSNRSRRPRSRHHQHQVHWRIGKGLRIKAARADTVHFFKTYGIGASTISTEMGSIILPLVPLTMADFWVDDMFDNNVRFVLRN